MDDEFQILKTFNTLTLIMIILKKDYHDRIETSLRPQPDISLKSQPTNMPFTVHPSFRLFRANVSSIHGRLASWMSCAKNLWLLAGPERCYITLKDSELLFSATRMPQGQEILRMSGSLVCACVHMCMHDGLTTTIYTLAHPPLLLQLRTEHYMSFTALDDLDAYLILLPFYIRVVAM